MFLDTTTRKIQISLGTAVATTEMSVAVDYVDFTTTATTPGLQLSATSGTSQVDILAAPASSTQRKINLITICNRDSDFQRVTVRLNDNGTTYNYVSAFSLAPQATLQFTDTRGWVVIDQNGNINVASGSYVDIQNFTANGTWFRPDAATYCLVDVCGGGGAGGGGSSATGTNSAGGGGGGGGRRITNTFIAKDLTQSVAVTVGAATSTTAAETDGSGGSVSRFGDFLIGYAGGGGAWNSDTAASAGGGGGGGTSSGTNALATSANGGSAFAISASNSSNADDRGAGGASAGSPGGSSYLGGGGGGSSNPVSFGNVGGSSFQSAAAGGGGGGYNFGTVTDNAGGDGGSTGGSATGAGGGGTGGTAAGGNGADGAAGDSTKAGTGGGGGGSNGLATAGNGGNGGAPGGGGGGGGGGLTGGTGGAGARGQVTVYSW